MARTGNAVVHDAQAFGFDILPTEDLAAVTGAIGGVARVSRHEFGDTKYRRIVYHSVATTRFRELLPRSMIAAVPGNIQRTEDWQDPAEAWLQPLVRDIPSSARPDTPDVVQTLRASAGSASTRARRRPTSVTARRSACGCAAMVLVWRRRAARRGARTRRALCARLGHAAGRDGSGRAARTRDVGVSQPLRRRRMSGRSPHHARGRFAAASSSCSRHPRRCRSARLRPPQQ